MVPNTTPGAVLIQSSNCPYIDFIEILKPELLGKSLSSLSLLLKFSNACLAPILIRVQNCKIGKKAPKLLDFKQTSGTHLGSSVAFEHF